MENKLHIYNLSDYTFKHEVLDSSKPVLVDFWADWCGTCQIMAPIIEKISDEYKEKIKIGKLNVDHFPVTTDYYGIHYIPTMLFFINGEIVSHFVGVVSREEITSNINLLMKTV